MRRTIHDICSRWTSLPRIRWEDERTFYAVSAALLGGTLLAILVISKAAGEEPDHWLDVYSSPRGAALIEMKKQFRAGPLPETALCYTVGALSIDALNEKHPDRDFMARCDDGDLVDMREAYDRAMQMLREEPKASK